jgi:hypothetical protein
MSEHLRALVVILGLATVVFAVVQHQSFGLPIAADDLRRRRHLWFAVTGIAFLAHNFWLYVFGVALVLFWARKRETNPLALFLMLLFAVPPFSAPIQGLGPIEQIFGIHHIRLLSLMILLPAWWSLRKQEDVMSFGGNWADRFLLMYLAYQLMLQLSANTFTNGLRQGLIYAFTDVFLPYYVASRSLRDVKAMRDAMASLAVAAALLAVVAIFESSKHWLLYASLNETLNVSFGMGGYLGRGDTGALRAVASTGHSIALGYVLVIALMLFIGLSTAMNRSLSWKAGVVTLSAGTIAALARGPWVGAVAGLMVYGLCSANPARYFARFAGWGALAVVLLLLSPYQDRVIALIPFVGETDADNVVYRQRLFDASVIVIRQNPWFGGGNYMDQLAELGMMQGEGIVDLVNTYLAVTLSQGLVGLALFLGVFIASAAPLVKIVAFSESRNGNEYAVWQSLLAAMSGALVVVATASPILCIPTMYWILAGLCVSSRRLAIPASAAFDVPVATRQQRPSTALSSQT